jgi:uncharacterized protein (TIGR02246 family)
MRNASIVVAMMLVTPALGQDKATIEKMNERFATAFNKGDTATVAQMYVEDAYLLPAGSPMVRGRSSIQTFWTKAGESVGDMKLTTEDVRPLGTDAAREIGTYGLKTKGSPAQEVVGKYVVIGQKIGSEWKLATDIWNTDK